MTTSLLKNDLLVENIDLIAGLLFGIAMQRGRVHETSLIVGQMTFSHFVMLKMFLSALGTSMIVASQYFKTATPEALENSWNKPRTPYETIIGAAILGIGMTVSGSCPGSVYPQLGALSVTALFVFLGAITGTVVFYYYQKAFPQRIGQPMDTNNNALHKVVNTAFNKSFSPSEFALIAGSSLLGAVFILELLVPWKSDIAHLYGGSTSSISFLNAQPPIISGIMIGIAQYLLTFVANRRLGCTASYESYITKIYCILRQQDKEKTKGICDVIECHVPESALCRTDHSQWNSTLGMIIGAFVSSLFGWSWYVGNAAEGFAGVSPLRSFIGGMLIVFGSRFAMGCTSGHGLTGCGFLSTTSALAVASMFSSAIVTGIVFKFIGV